MPTDDYDMIETDGGSKTSEEPIKQEPEYEIILTGRVK